MAKAAVEVEALGKSFGEKRALDDLSFTIPEGAVLGLLGTNGAGKTTAVRTLATLLPLDRGCATIAGHDVRSDPAGVRRSIGLAGQHATVDGFLTGTETLELVGLLRGLGRSERARQTRELLDRFDLHEKAGAQVRTYSGGTRRRLDLAACLVGSPSVLFLDEPTTGLDAYGRRALWDAVRAQVRDGAAVLLTTQYLEEADVLADELVVLDSGRIVARGGSSELKAKVGALSLCVRVPRGEASTVLNTIEGAAIRDGGVESQRDGACSELSIPLARSADALPAMALLATLNIDVEAVRLEEPTLDSVFFALTERSRSRGAIAAPASDGR